MADSSLTTSDHHLSGFRELIEKAADGVLVVRTDGRIVHANPEAARLLGRAIDELVGAIFGLPIIPGETTEIDLFPARLGQSEQGEAGAPIVAEMRVVEVRWEGDLASLATLRDVTQRKRDGEALRFLSDASNLLAGSLDRATTLDNVGRLAVKHLADWCLIDLVEGPRDPAHPSNLTLRRFAYCPGDSDRVSRAQSLCGEFLLTSFTTVGIGRVVGAGCMEVFSRVGDEEVQALALDPSHVGTFLGLGCRSALIAPMVARGRPIGAISFCSATPYRFSIENEQTLAQDLADRAALAVDNARLYDEAQDALRRRDEFLAMLAHELRNPLSPILHAATLLGINGHRDEDRARHRATIERQGRHLSRLLDDLLDLSRINHGKIDLSRQPIDLADVVRDALQLAREGLESRRHHLTLEMELGPLIVNGDQTRLAQVLGNLLANAIRYTPSGGNIGLRVYRDAYQVILRVSDNGRGIPVSSLGRVFEPFLQLNPTPDRHEGGLGIGLTLVRRLVELHGGQVSASSEGEGKGSVFEVRLPLSPTLVPKVEPAPAVFSDGNRVPPRSIVLVEDNPDGRDMLGELLRTFGHEVLEAGDGVTGLEYIRQRMPDVALVDIGLPQMDGYRLAQEVRRLPGGDQILLIALTGYGQPGDRTRALEAGFDDHCIKPVDLSTLAHIIEQSRNGL